MRAIALCVAYILILHLFGFPLIIGVFELRSRNAPQRDGEKINQDDRSIYTFSSSFFGVLLLLDATELIRREKIFSVQQYILERLLYSARIRNSMYFDSSLCSILMNDA